MNRILLGLAIMVGAAVLPLAVLAVVDLTATLVPGWAVGAVAGLVLLFGGIVGTVTVLAGVFDSGQQGWQRVRGTIVRGGAALLLLPVAAVGLLLSLAITVMHLATGGWPWVPSDAAMIAHFQERRPQFEALVGRLSEGRATGRIGLDWMDSGAEVRDWVGEVRGLMRAVGARVVEYRGRDEPIVIGHHAFGAVDSGSTKEFAFRHRPADETVHDMHGPDAEAVVRAFYCEPDRRDDLRHLCGGPIRVNDLDALDRVHDGPSYWTAERPIDKHWSIVLTRTR